MFLGIINVVAFITASFLLLLDSIPFYGYTILFTSHQLMIIVLFPLFVCFAVTNIHVQVFVWTSVFISFSVDLGIELLGHMLNLYVTF